LFVVNLGVQDPEAAYLHVPETQTQGAVEDELGPSTENTGPGNENGPSIENTGPGDGEEGEGRRTVRFKRERHYGVIFTSSNMSPRMVRDKGTVLPVQKGRLHALFPSGGQGKQR
jgi:hypothetical protein